MIGKHKQITIKIDMKYLTRRNANTGIGMWKDFESFFNTPSFFTSSNPLFDWNPQSNSPATDLYEDDSSYIVQVELPGFDRKEIQVELDKDRMVLKGTRKEQGNEGSPDISFHRSVTLPGSVKSKKITASYENGILTVSVPKAEPTKPLRIEVKS